MEFDITEAALEAIRKRMLSLPIAKRDRYIPAVAWAVAGHESDFRPGPVIGGFERSQIPDTYIFQVRDVELTHSLPAEILAEVRGKSLDYKEGRFFFS